jgi:hypothetical protein
MAFDPISGAGDDDESWLLLPIDKTRAFTLPQFSGVSGVLFWLIGLCKGRRF